MPEPTRSQKTAFKRLQEVDPNAEVRWDEKTGTPARLRGALSGAQKGTPETIARQFLAASKNLYAMKAPEEELQLKAVDTDMRGNQHVRFQQMYKGRPVLGDELVVHMSGENAIRGVSGKFTPRIDLPDEPEVPAEDARKTVLEDAPDNKERPGEEPLLLILVHEGKPYLAWQMTVDGIDEDLFGNEKPALWVYFVDALTGKAIWHYNNLQDHIHSAGTGK
jgi:bacillolysin